MGCCSELPKRLFHADDFWLQRPKTDVEAKALLKEGWGDVNSRNMEQTEIICKPGKDHADIKETWKDFIHTHHFKICDSFWNSWIASHPRRSGEAYWSQYYDAQFVQENSVPQHWSSLEDLVDWYKPLIQAELNQTAQK